MMAHGRTMDVIVLLRHKKQHAKVILVTSNGMVNVEFEI